MDKSRKPKAKQTKPAEKAAGARRYLGGGGGMLPTGEGPHVIGTDDGIARVQEHPEDMPGTSPDIERSPGRGGWHF